MLSHHHIIWIPNLWLLLANFFRLPTGSTTCLIMICLQNWVPQIWKMSLSSILTRRWIQTWRIWTFCCGGRPISMSSCYWMAMNFHMIPGKSILLWLVNLVFTGQVTWPVMTGKWLQSFAVTVIAGYEQLQLQSWQFLKPLWLMMTSYD